VGPYSHAGGMLSGDFGAGLRPRERERPGGRSRAAGERGRVYTDNGRSRSAACLPDEEEDDMAWIGRLVDKKLQEVPTTRRRIRASCIAQMSNVGKNS